MQNDIIEIENIECMRLREGINDLELRQDIRGLRIGHCVKLTLVSGDRPLEGETVTVRITVHSRRIVPGQAGKAAGVRCLQGPGGAAPLTFSTAHIHSILKARPPEQG